MAADIKINGVTPSAFYVGDTAASAVYYGSTKLWEAELPAKTMRLQFNAGVTPTFSKGTATQVSSSPNVWDLTYSDSNWSKLLLGQTELIRVIDANTSGVTRMSEMFVNCSGLQNIPLLDTSSVTSMFAMFANCSSLQTIPLLDTSNVITIENMCFNCTSLQTVPLFNTTINLDHMENAFSGCVNVTSGALALYTQASKAGAGSSSRYHCFYNCGSNTVTGQTELAQIPTVWGGTMANNTLMFRFGIQGYDPSSLTTLTGATWTQISSSPNVWLWDASSVRTTDWSGAFYSKFQDASSSGDVELIAASTLTTPTTVGMDGSPYNGMFGNNTALVSSCALDIHYATNCSRIFNRCVNLGGHVAVRCPSATSVNQMFRGCSALESFTLSKTYYVKDFQQLCLDCTSLQTVPSLDTHAATNVTEMFSNCIKVTGGALALYNQMSTQTTPPATYTNCFADCGVDTVTGLSELEQIPSSWGGIA